MDETEGLATAVLDAAFDLHRRLGPGLLEIVYESLIARHLTARGIEVRRQPWVDFYFDGAVVRRGFRPDLIVGERLLVEVKVAERIIPIHCRQLLTYLKATDLRLGLVLNFGGVTMKEGVRRVVNNHAPTDSPLRIHQKSDVTGWWTRMLRAARARI